MTTLPGDRVTYNPGGRNGLDLTLFGTCIVTLGLMVVVVSRIVPGSFALQFNPYSLISIAGLIINLLLLVTLIRRSNRSSSVMWFAFYIIFSILWSAVEALQRSSATPQTALFWSSTIVGITTLLPACLYLFVRSYTSREKTVVPLWVPVVIFGTGAVLAALLGGDGVYRLASVPDLEPWGFVGPTNGATILCYAWGGALALASVARLFIFLRQSKTQNERRIAQVFIVGVIMLLVFSGVTEVFLPFLGIEGVPPLGVMVNALLAFVVIIGIYKYGSFALGADEIADAVLSTMADGVVVTDLDYNVIYRNDSAQHMLAALGRDIMGINFRTAYSERDDANRQKWENDLAAHGFAATGDIEVGTPAHRVTINLNIAPLQADRPGYIFVISDVTEIRVASNILKAQSAKLEHSNSALMASQVAMTGLLDDAKKLELALKNEKASVEHEVKVQTAAVEFGRTRLEAALNGLDVAVYMVNSKLELVYANKAMEDLYFVLSNSPWSPEEYMRNLKANPDFIKEVDLVQVKHKVVEHPEFQAQGRILRTYQAPILDPANPTGHAIGSVGSIQDITDAKATERSRDEFFSIASHELRTPLTAIRGNTSMIQDYYADQIQDPELKGMISDIHDSSIRLITLVNDFLNTSRLEQGKIEFKLAAFSAADLITEVIGEFVAGNPTAKIPIKTNFKTVPLILADRDRLKEVLLNLIGNAVKFTDKGAITVGLSMEKRQIKLTVTDTGSGIPMESRSLLFRKFQQASNNILTRDSTRSTGLGLYISKLITIGMGGTIALEKSAVGKGSTFAVQLPAAGAVAPKRKPIGGTA